MGAEDVERAANFWAEALDYEIVKLAATNNDFTEVRPRSLAGVSIGLQKADTPTQDDPRVHIDVLVSTTEEQEAEIERLVKLGAQRVDWPHYPDDPDFVVMADTEGNRFCVVNAAE